MKSNFKFMPIGLLLKKLDGAITKASDKVLLEYGLSRLEWQMFNVIKRQERPTEKRVIDDLSPFAGSADLGLIIKTSIHLGLITRNVENLMLTGKGEKLLEKAATAQDRIRQRLVRGISEEKYVDTMQTLTKMLDNISQPQQTSVSTVGLYSSSKEFSDPASIDASADTTTPSCR